MSLFDSFYNFLVAHPGEALVIWTGITGFLQYFFGVFAQSLRAPTANCSQAYLTFFQLVNAAAANWHRAGVPKVENSPNFEAAVELYLKNRAAAPATIAAITEVQKQNGGTA